MRYLARASALIALLPLVAIAQTSHPSPAQIEEFGREVDGAVLMAAMEGDAKRSAALELTARWIAQHPRIAAGYNKRGEVLLIREEREAAIRDFSKAIELDAKFSLAWSNRGRARALSGDHAAAMVDLNRALELSPDDGETLVLRGQVHAATGGLERAVADCSRAIELSGALLARPVLIEALRVRASVHEAQGNSAAAIEDCTKLLNQLPDPVMQAETWFRRAELQRKVGAKDKAAADYNAVLRQDPTHAGAKAGLAALQPPTSSGGGDLKAQLQTGAQMLQQRNVDGAIAAFAEAIRLAPNEPAGYDGRGRAFALKREFEKAIEDFTKIIELRPNDVNGYLRRAATYGQLRKKEAAVADLRSVLRLQPDSKPAAQMLKQFGETP